MKSNRLDSLLRDLAPFVVLVALFVMTFLLGGSSREDEVAVLLLRPFAILCLLAGAIFIARSGTDDWRPLVVPAAAVAGIVAIQLVPLPPFVWQALPGRELMTQAAAHAGAAGTWQPFTMVPWRGANTFFSMSVPVAALILLAAARPPQRIAMMTLFAGFATLSALLGLLQTVAPGAGAFRMYSLTSEGVPTGLLANRNHQAALLACAIPAIAAVVARNGLRGRTATGWRVAAAAAALLIVPMAFLTGSRAGLFLLALGLFFSLFILPRDWLAALRPGSGRSWLVTAALAVVGIVALAVAVYLVFRINAAEKVSATNIGDDLRFQYWLPTLGMIWTYFPFGSGAGSFVEVFQIAEPNALLGPNYVNHAHNDWLELVLEGGLIAVALLVFAVWQFFRRLREVAAMPRAESVTARAALAIVFILALGSVFDYPLRVPALAVVFVLACAWSLTRDDVPRRAR